MAHKIYIWNIHIMYAMYNQYIYKIRNLMKVNGRRRNSDHWGEKKYT